MTGDGDRRQVLIL